MPNLYDHIDRFSYISQSISSTARRTKRTPGPFTSAVLDLRLDELLRDADDAERGLFNIEQPPGDLDVSLNSLKPQQVSRKEFVGATPLRKATRAYDAPNPAVYLDAAIKYANTYKSIKPMPRTEQQIETLRQRFERVQTSIQTLESALGENAKGEPISAKSAAEEEEKRIRQLQSRIAEMKQRCEAMREQKAKKPRPASAATEAELTPSKPVGTIAATPGGKDDEDAFWINSASDHDDLLSEEIGNLSHLQSPMPPPRGQALRFASGPRTPQTPVTDFGSAVEPEDEEEDEGDDETTIVLAKPPAIPETPVPSSAATEPVDETPGAPTPLRSSSKSKRLRITNEMEKIVSKIWVTLGEVILPHNHYDVSGTTAGGKPPPDVKDTIKLLETLSTMTPSVASPSSHSTLSSFLPPSASLATPTQPQIATAMVLLTLLLAPGPPAHSMPLNQLKQELGSKIAWSTAEPVVGGGGPHIRAIYSCVAKKAIKIDRGAGGQVVRFDI